MTKQELKEKLEEAHPGDVYDTEELQKNFVVEHFNAPYVKVKKKETGESGYLLFNHSPRLYYNFG